tara:strand:+ start:9812 stop:10504 length:693 start_codon:yes stop_codon:yes gene_type:complete
MSKKQEIQNFLIKKYPSYVFEKSNVPNVPNAIMIKINDKNCCYRLVAHIAYELCEEDGINSIYLNFIRVENEYEGKGLSKYVMGYFIGDLIDKYGEISISLQNATNDFIKFNVQKCNRMKTQVRALTNNRSIVLPRNSKLRSGKVRIDKNYWKKFGFEFKDDDPSEMEYTGSLTSLYNKLVKEINKDFGFLTFLFGGSEYIKTKNGRRKIHVGKRGGKYYMMNNKKVYIK